MISQTAEYALRAITHLASQQGRARTTQQIAEATQVPGSYLAKVMQALVRCGLLRSQRGLHGGFRLARPAEEMTVLEVINGVDPLQRIEACPLGIEAHHELCPLHRRLDDAVALVEASFRSTTVAELIDAPVQPVAGCQFPCVTTPSGEVDCQ